MCDYFKQIVDVDFTAGMERKLDYIEEGSEEWKSVVGEFFAPLQQAIEKAEKEISKVVIEDKVSDVPCDKCGRMMVYKYGRFGKFLACPGYPECKNAKPLVETIDELDSIGKIVNFKFKIVSLEGDILFPGGAVSGGEAASNSDDKLSLLKLTNEYNDKKGLLQSISVTLDNANDKYEELEKEISEINYKLTEKRVLIENKERGLIIWKLVIIVCLNY